MRNKGFTLIELLVVIAIIGVLSSLAVVSLNNARGKANDVKVQSNVTTASTNIELLKANNELDAAKVSSTIRALGAPACSTSNWETGDDGNTNLNEANISVYAKFCSTQTGQHTTDDYFCADTSGFRGVVSSTASVSDGTCQ